MKSWQFIGRFENGDTQYINTSESKRERGYVKVATLIDYKKPVWSYSSKRILSESGTDYIDCKSKRYFILSSLSFECHMAKCAPKNSAIYQFDEAGFLPITNMNSQIGNVFDLVCQ